MLFWTLEEFEQFDNVIDDLEYKHYSISYIGLDVDVEKLGTKLE